MDYKTKLSSMILGEVSEAMKEYIRFIGVVVQRK